MADLSHTFDDSELLDELHQHIQRNSYYDRATIVETEVTHGIMEERQRRLLPLQEFLDKARKDMPKARSQEELLTYASEFGYIFMQVLYSAGAGNSLEMILMSTVGETLHEIDQRSPQEAAWYTRAHAIGTARGVLGAGNALLYRATNGDLAAQKVFLENAGVLNTAAKNIKDARLIAQKTVDVVVPADVATSLQTVFDENF